MYFCTLLKRAKTCSLFCVVSAACFGQSQLTYIIEMYFIVIVIVAMCSWISRTMYVTRQEICAVLMYFTNIFNPSFFSSSSLFASLDYFMLISLIYQTVFIKYDTQFKRKKKNNNKKGEVNFVRTLAKSSMNSSYQEKPVYIHIYVFSKISRIN